MKKFFLLLYGTACYIIFLGTFLYAICFTGNFYVPKTIDSGTASTGLLGILINVLLLTVFALQHSIMARPNFKRWWIRIIGASAERSTYVLLASSALIVLFWKWQAYPSVIWQTSNPILHGALTVLFFAGWGIVLLATFMISHFDLFGLKQVFYYFRNKPLEETGFKTNWLYRIVRHPIMLGFLIAFWATPVMTLGHLLFASVTTVYILVAIKFLEEKDLERSIGKQYTEYKRKVPMLVPFSKRTA